MPVHREYTGDNVLASIRASYEAKGSFRRVAVEDFGGRVSHATIARIVAGIEPRKLSIRRALGLPVEARILTEPRLCACLCGEWFHPMVPHQVRLPGHPRRRVREARRAESDGAD